MRSSYERNQITTNRWIFQLLTCQPRSQKPLKFEIQSRGVFHNGHLSTDVRPSQKRLYFLITGFALIFNIFLKLFTQKMVLSV